MGIETIVVLIVVIRYNLFAMSDTEGSEIAEQIADLQKKIALLDGDRKAYYENSQWTMQKTKRRFKDFGRKIRTCD